MNRQPVHAGLHEAVVLPLSVEHIVIDDEGTDAAGGHGVVRRLVGLAGLVSVVPSFHLAADAGAGGDDGLVLLLLRILELALSRHHFTARRTTPSGRVTTGIEAGAAGLAKDGKPKILQHVAVKKMKDGPDVGDNSNSQYLPSALGLRACFDAGVTLPEGVVLLAVNGGARASSRILRRRRTRPSSPPAPASAARWKDGTTETRPASPTSRRTTP